MGQIYQELGFESAAFDYYRKCIHSNPEYELSFYAKLNMAQVTQLGEKSDIKDIRKYFKKLAKDEKNIEFQDRIYYEWAKFELKQGYLSESLANFNQAIQTSKNNPRIKGLAYLSLGEVYFDTLKDYSLAQAYYDSAVTTLPKTYEAYEQVAERSEVLTRFVEQINTITLQDSLLSLSTRDSAEVMALFKEEAQRRMTEKEALEAKKARKEATESFFAFNQEPTAIAGGNWYFTNPAAVSKGRTEFTRIWGERNLEDHWRRSVKSSVIETETEASTDTLATEANEVVSKEEQMAEMANSFFAQLPHTKEDVAKAEKMLEDAYYNLANIYHFELNEDASAVENYSILLKRFPTTLYEPEVLYLLFLIEEDRDKVKAEDYKKTLFKKYPKSLYANLILNPQFVEESNKANEKLAKDYKKAFALFKAGDYTTARHFITNALTNYPNVAYTQNFALLDALIIGKTATLPEYQLALKEFINNYPEGELNTYAKKLLEASKTYQSRLVKLKETTFSKVLDFQDHYFVMVVDSMGIQPAIALAERMINSKFDGANLKAGSLELNKNQEFVIVKTFKGKEEALLFYDLMKAEQSPETIIFVVSKQNFELLHQTKELDNYLTFFEENY